MLFNPNQMGEFKMAHKKKAHVKSKHAPGMVKEEGVHHGHKAMVAPMAKDKGKKHQSRGK